MHRRDFIKQTSLMSAGAMLLPDLGLDWSSTVDFHNIGLQLYTVRDDMNENPLGTLKAISKIGYKHVECAGYRNGKFYGQTKENFKMILRDMGLKMHSGHAMTGFGQDKDTYSMTYKWESYCEDAAFMEQKYIVSAYFMEGERKTIDDYKRHAALFNECAVIAQKYNLIFCHHNHDFEFIPINGIVPYDIFLSETDPKLVKFELDHYWTTKANVNTKKLIKKNPGRFPIFHIKDMDASPDKSFAEVGSGVINWKSVFKLAPKAGMDLFFVEQDFCKNMKPLESIKVSYDYLNSLNV